MNLRNVSSRLFQLALFIISVLIILLSTPLLTWNAKVEAARPISIRPEGMLEVSIERNCWSSGVGESFSYFITNPSSEQSVDLWRVEISLDRNVEMRESWWINDIEIWVRNENTLVIRGAYSIGPNTTISGGCNLIYLATSTPTSTPTATPTSTPTSTPSPTVVVTVSPTNTPSPTSTTPSESTPTVAPTAIPSPSSTQSASSLETQAPTLVPDSLSSEDNNTVVDSNAEHETADEIIDQTDIEELNSEDVEKHNEPREQDESDYNQNDMLPAGIIYDSNNTPSDGTGISGNILLDSSTRRYNQSSFPWPLLIILVIVFAGICYVFIMFKKREKEQKRPMPELIGDFIYGANEEMRNVFFDRIKPLFAGIVGKLSGGSFDQSYADAQMSGASDDSNSHANIQSELKTGDKYSDAHRMRPPKK